MNQFQLILAIIVLCLNNFRGTYSNKTLKCERNLYATNADRIGLHAFYLENSMITKTSLEITNCASDGARLHGVCKTKSKIKLIVHGFAERWNMTTRWDWVKIIINEMLISNEANQLCVIAIDWKELANGGYLLANYLNAIQNMNNAGEIVANILYSANQHRTPTPYDVHCIGFSLGAHLCSIIYKIHVQKFGQKLDRITGLDPAGLYSCIGGTKIQKCLMTVRLLFEKMIILLFFLC
jgi:hypothetical protein